MSPFPFDKKIFFIILILAVIANIVYYNIRMNADHIFDPDMNLMLSLFGYLIFFPILSAALAIIVALFLNRSIPLSSRFKRSFWVCLLCVNWFLVLTMIVQIIRNA